MAQYKVALGGEDLGVFDEDEITIDLAMELEDKTGMTITEMLTGVSRASARALQALVWFQRRTLGQPANLHESFKLTQLQLTAVEEPADPTQPGDAGKLSENDEINTSAS